MTFYNIHDMSLVWVFVFQNTLWVNQNHHPKAVWELHECHGNMFRRQVGEMGVGSCVWSIQQNNVLGSRERFIDVTQVWGMNIKVNCFANWFYLSLKGLNRRWKSLNKNNYGCIYICFTWWNEEMYAYFLITIIIKKNICWII